jgi:murein DD-endopeptidase MepM/ murein hydrolase activator NlpD
MRLGIALAALLATTAPALAGHLELSSPIEQGALVRGLAEPGAKATLDGRELPVAPDGRFIFGFSRDAAAKAILDVTFRDGTRERRELGVAAHPYDIQRIEGLPENQVTPDPATLARIKHDSAMVRAAHETDSAALFFETPLVWPATGPISGVYGSQRILNGQPRAPHLGTDIAAPIGTPVVAAAAGKVTLAEPDFVLDGSIVIIDHGYGLSTLYMHLSAIDVHVGDSVAQGQKIGAVGRSGRVTGPHLHWGVNWYATALDPVLAAGPMPVSPASADAAKTNDPAARGSSPPESH